MSIMLRVVVLLGMACLLCGNVSAQNWHFSNGWESGKRSSLTDCQFRPHVRALISRIIDDELRRIQRVCSRPAYPLEDNRPFLQGKNRQTFEPDQ